MNVPILKTQELCKYFFSTRWSFPPLKREKITVKAVDRCNMEVFPGEILSIVGESGSGKTTLGQSIGRIKNPTSGQIWFSGKEITDVQGTDLKAVRREIQMVFQDPGSSLNPRHRIDDIISLPIKIHLRLSRKEQKDRVKELLQLVQLPTELMPRYPHALSGGQKQRVGIARALSLQPKLVILDEPTSALDVSVQAKILHLLKDLQQQFGLTYILITHNLSIVKNFSNKIMVMYLGRVVETGPTDLLFHSPLHPYTRALLSAHPAITDEEKRLMPADITLDGEIPSPAHVPRTCAFVSRCPEKIDLCLEHPDPCLQEAEGGRFVRCLLEGRSPPLEGNTEERCF